MNYKRESEAWLYIVDQFERATLAQESGLRPDQFYRTPDMTSGICATIDVLYGRLLIGWYVKRKMEERLMDNSRHPSVDQVCRTLSSYYWSKRTNVGRKARIAFCREMAVHAQREEEARAT